MLTTPLLPSQTDTQDDQPAKRRDSLELIVLWVSAGGRSASLLWAEGGTT